MSMTISVRIGPVRANGYSGQRAHDLRKGKPLPYVDESRKDLNTGGFVPTLREMHDLNEDAKYAAKAFAAALWEAAKASGDPSVIKAAKDVRSACRLKYDEEGVVAYRMILTFGREALELFELMNSAEVDALAWWAMKQVAETLGTDVVGRSGHRDESALHYHAYLRAVTDKGKKLNPKKGDCRQIQTAAAKPFGHLGVKRGKSKNLWIEEGADTSKYINMSVAELHASLPLELAAAREEVNAAKMKLEGTQQALADTQITLKMVQLESARADHYRMLAEQEVQRLQKRISELEGESGRLESIGASWNGRIKAKEATCRELDAKIEAKNRELDTLLGIVHSTREQQSIDEHVQHELKLDASQRQKVQKGPEVE